MNEHPTPTNQTSPSGSRRIRAFIAQREILPAESAGADYMPSCPKHLKPSPEFLCPQCEEIALDAGRRLRPRLERDAGGDLAKALSNHASLSVEIRRFIQLDGVVGQRTIAVPDSFRTLLDPRQPIKAACRANARLLRAIEEARVAEVRLNKASESLGYSGLPSEQKLLRLLDESDAAARFLEEWDGLAFDGRHELELTNHVQRIYVNDRDCETMFSTVKHRPMEQLRDAGRAWRTAVQQLMVILHLHE